MKFVCKIKIFALNDAMSGRAPGEDATKQRGHAIVGTASKTIPYLERLIKGKG